MLDVQDANMAGEDHSEGPMERRIHENDSSPAGLPEQRMHLEESLSITCTVYCILMLSSSSASPHRPHSFLLFPGDQG